MKRTDLEHYLANYLELEGVDDYCPNGLQIQGKENIERLVTAVSASEELIEAAIEKKADAIIVHHGLIWKGFWNQITGPYYRKVKSCLDHGINLFAYHLPLDAHMEVGNAACLARLLNLKKIQKFALHNALNYGVSGHFEHGIEAFLKIVTDEINSDALCIMTNDSTQNIAIVTGGGQSEFQKAIDSGFDTFITGEASEWVYHMAKEYKVNYIAAGHHASERFGVQALGEKLEKEFSVSHLNIDLGNPI